VNWPATIRQGTERFAVDISVIICTYNRPDSLRQTLDSLCGCRLDASRRWELIVVDNDPSAQTRTVCDRYTDRLPLRYLTEPRKGLSCARNRGLDAARGELVLFTDDDVDVDPDWLAQLWSAAQRQPDAAIFGGKILPRWEQPPPAWLVEHARTLLPGVTMHFDIGDTERFLGKCDMPFFGANMGFRRSVFGADRRFREDLGHWGDRPTPGEETELIRRLMAEGCRAFYVPAAAVTHRNPAHRMSERYVRAWFVGQGIAKVRLGEAASRGSVLGVPSRYFKRLFGHALRYLWVRWRKPSSVWLPTLIEMAGTWGLIVGCWQRRGNDGHEPRRPSGPQ
jgi:glycosyltransferase involved in cell wall biosynthesis